MIRPEPSPNVLQPISLNVPKKKRTRKAKKAEEPEKIVALYVGDIDPNATERVLLETFSKISPVKSLKLCPPGPRGLRYAYVNFGNASDANRARDELNYTKLLNSEIRIMPSMRDSDTSVTRLGTNVFFSNLPQLTTRDFYEKFRKGEVLSCKVDHPKRQGFMLFSQRADAAAVMDKYNGAEFKGHQLYVGIHTAKDERERQRHLLERSAASATVVYVNNLPYQATETQVRAMFSPFGTIISLFVKPVARIEACWALVTLDSLEAARAAIFALNDKIVGSKAISCSLAERQEHLQERANTNSVLVRGLLSEISQKELVERCGVAGKVIQVVTRADVVAGLLTSEAIVSFETDTQARNAVYELDCKKLNDGSILHVSLYSKQSKPMSMAPIQNAAGQFMFPVAYGNPLGLTMKSDSEAALAPPYELTMSHLENVVGKILDRLENEGSTAPESAETVAAYILKVFWSGDITALAAYLSRHEDEIEPAVICTQVERAVGNLRLVV